MPSTREVFITAALALSVAACGGPNPSASVPAVTTTPTAGVPAGPRTVVFHEREFKFEPSALTLKPGDYVFQFVDDGKYTHDFHIVPKGSTTELAATSKPLRAGETDTLKVTLAKGVYSFWCNVGQHRKAGMEGSITVASS